MTFGFLTNAAKVIEWARRLVSDMNQRDAQIEKRLADIERRLDAGGL